MPKTNQRIEIVRSSIKGLSCLSRGSCDAIHAVLAKHFSQVGVTVVDELADLQILVNKQPDLVFLGMEYIPNDYSSGLVGPNKIWLSEFLDAQKIAYTGSGQAAHRLGRNKQLAKQLVLEAGLESPAYYIVEQNQPFDGTNILLDFPMFVKPANSGGGRGIDSDSVVHTVEQLRSKANSIFTNLRSDVLIEEYLPGREYSVAILKDEYSDDYLAMPLELVAPADEHGNRLLSGPIKLSNTEQAIEVTEVALKSRVMELALAVFEALGARDYGRIDIRLDAAGAPHFLEANLIPSLISGYGSFPKACKLNIGLEYEEMIIRIAELGLARNIHVTENILEPLTLNLAVLSSSKESYA